MIRTWSAEFPEARQEVAKSEQRRAALGLPLTASTAECVVAEEKVAADEAATGVLLNLVG
jgi:hypothetical protein